MAAYASMTTNERLRWHADVYAFRRVFLGVPDSEHTSPCDEKGEWFDPDLVEAATAVKRRKYNRRRK
jgi:hypothetical protein